MKTKVLVIDDWPLMRAFLTDIINAQSDMEVVGSVATAEAAKDVAMERNPDVVILEAESPHMDKSSALDRTARLRLLLGKKILPLVQQSPDGSLRAVDMRLLSHAINPTRQRFPNQKDYTGLIIECIRSAARGDPAVCMTATTRPCLSVDTVLARSPHPSTGPERVIVVGASTGGTDAIKQLLIQMPINCPGILITQHIPEGFTRSFVQRLDDVCRIKVKQAEQGERVMPGHAYISPGHCHLLLTANRDHYLTELNDGNPVNRHRPSVDVLFRSAANCAGKNAIGIILTGMGNDGAVGMLEMKQAGAYNFAQDEASCVVFGMPREAIAAGAVHEVVPLTQITRRVLDYLAVQNSRLARSIGSG